MTGTDDGGHGRAALRQFSISLAESVQRPALSVILRWRTFPCAASHWDGQMFCEVPWTTGPIRDQEALRAALMAAAMEEWDLRPTKRA